MKVCFYAINGHGMGHLSRSYAIAKRLRLLLGMLAEEADIQFLTTSQADYLIRDFPVFKIPSRASFKGKKSAASRYTANGKMMISSMLSHFSPHLLVMDTIATGSFNEFHFVKSFAQKTVLVERHKNTSTARSDIHQSHLHLFDSILVPEESSQLPDYAIPSILHEQTHFVGRIHGVDPMDQWSREDSRNYFGASDTPLIYLSAGGGGDPEATTQLAQILTALESIECKVIIGYGPLNHEEKVYSSDKVRPYTELGISRFFKGFDFAISAAGYNSYEELLYSKIPTAFFTQEKGMDDQARRVSYGVLEQWHYQLNLDGDIKQQIMRCLDQGSPSGLASREIQTGAINAASAMAELYFEKHEEKLILLRLASIALKWLELQKWKTSDPTQDFYHFSQFMKSLPIAKKLDFTMKTLSDDEESLVSENFLLYLTTFTELNQKMKQLCDENHTEIKRLFNRVLKEVAGNITALQQWIKTQH